MIQKRLPRSPRDNNDYELSNFLRKAAVLPAVRDWGFPQQPLNQVKTSHCGGFSLADKRASPGSAFGSIPQTDRDGHDYYYLIKALEGVKPNDPTYEDGVYTRDALKLCVQLGWARAYAFASDLNSAKSFILGQDTLLFGSVWLADMFDTDAEGFIHFGGNVAGGHLWEVRGFDSDRDVWTGQQSWGPWGYQKNGTFYIKGADFEALYKQSGEIGAVVETANVPVPTPGNGCYDLQAMIARNIKSMSASKDPNVQLYIKSLQAQLAVLKAGKV